MTVRELISRISTAINRGKPSDTSISKRYIYNIAKTVRSKILYEQELKRLANKEFFVQTIGCVQLEKVDWNECNLKPNSNCFLLKSKKPVPIPIGGEYVNVFTDTFNKYSRTTVNKLSTPSDRYEFVNLKNQYFLRNINGETYLYLISLQNPKWLNIEGLFEDEEEVKKYCNENSCTSILDTEFFVDNRLIDNIIKLCLDEIQKSYQRGVVDMLNNGKDETGKTT